MTATDSARRKLAAAPADLRFAALFSSREQRPALTALLAVYTEVREILRECQDAGVARTKLGWWQKEMELLVQHQPRHPLCKVLDTCLHGYTLPAQTLIDVTASVSADISALAFQHYEEVEHYCRLRGGALTELAAQIGGPQSAATLEAARWLGQSWQLADIVLNGLEYARLGRNYFASDDLRRHGVDSHVADDHHSAAGVQTLLQDYAQRAQALRTNALVIMGTTGHNLTCGRVLAGLASARLKKLAARAYKPTATPVELHAFTRLWIAWRSARLAH